MGDNNSRDEQRGPRRRGNSLLKQYFPQRALKAMYFKSWAI